MQRMKPIATVILDTRRMKKSGKYPVKVRVTLSRKQEYYSTGIDCSQDEWNAIQLSKVAKEHKQLRENVDRIRGKAISIVENLRVFTFPKFEKEFYSKSKVEYSLITYFEEYIKSLNEEERISTAKSYENALNSLLEYKWVQKSKGKKINSEERKLLATKVKLSFEEITPEFLQHYENWMVREQNSISTVGIYLRTLRAVFNLAIADDNISKDIYPFGKRKYEIPASRNIKKSLSIVDVRAILNYPSPASSTEDKAKDFWLFSYLCNGINIKDIALLKVSDVQGDYIEFVREKTKRTNKKNQKPIRFFLVPEAKEVISKWANKSDDPNDFLFPVVTREMNALQRYKTIHQFIKTVNKYMKQIKNDLGIEKDVTTYTARHTYSTVLKRSGVSTEFISEALGHANKKTTENYLDSFENDALKEIAGKLL